jgi:hypothetical protein
MMMRDDERQPAVEMILVALMVWGTLGPAGVVS